MLHMPKKISILILVFTIFAGYSYAAIGESISSFEKSKLIHDFVFDERTTKTLTTGEKANLYKNHDGSVVEIILDDNGNIKKQILITPVSANGSDIKLLYPEIMGEFINEASTSRINEKGIRKIEDEAIKKDGVQVYENNLDLKIYTKLVKPADAAKKVSGVWLLSVIFSKASIAKKASNEIVYQSDENIVVDLNKGTVNGTGIGPPLKFEDMVKLIGKQPEDNIYFYTEGLAVGVTGEPPNRYCFLVSIYLNDGREQIGNKVISFNAFKGQVFPLNKNEDMQEIKKKLGEPSQYLDKAFNGSPLMKYDTPYGYFTIVFGKKGIVEYIDVVASKK